MATETTRLHMVRLRLDVRRLLTRARLERLPLRDVDLGYLVHCGLIGLFGERAPGPFSIREVRGRFVDILAYGDVGAHELRHLAYSTAEPGARESCLWDALAARPMPARWVRGSAYHFEVRTCPVIRKSAEGPKHRRGAEVDAFLARCWSVGRGVPVNRGAVYVEWLQEQFERRRAATVLRARLEAFRRSRLIRRTQGAGRRAHACERPDALLRGTLQVNAPDAFQTLLGRGIGRHRAFGFGMLLLAPVGGGSC